MGVSYYNPTGRLGPTIPRQGAPTDPETEEERARRIAASRYGGSSTPAPTPTPTPAPAPAPSGGTGTGPETEAERARRIAESRYDGGSPSAPTATTAGSGESEGIGEWLSKTRIGGGLGVVLNNPYVKGVLQGASVLGTAGAFTASLGNEIGDAIRGEGFSPQDLYDQTNPLFFLHGENEEDKFGWGDTWREQGQALGAGDNKWVDAGIGFAGDLSLDPANYIGIGLVDKGLDALRAGLSLRAWRTERQQPPGSQGLPTRRRDVELRESLLAGRLGKLRYQMRRSSSVGRLKRMAHSWMSCMGGPMLGRAPLRTSSTGLEEG